MTTIESPIKCIDELRFFPLPTKPLTGIDFVFADGDSRTIIVRATDGKIYTNAIGKSVCYPFDDHPRALAFLDKLYRAKIISRAALMEHKKRAGQSSEKRRIRRVALELRKYAEALKLPLTKEQKLKLSGLEK